MHIVKCMTRHCKCIHSARSLTLGGSTSIVARKCWLEERSSGSASIPLFRRSRCEVIFTLIFFQSVSAIECHISSAFFKTLKSNLISVCISRLNWKQKKVSKYFHLDSLTLGLLTALELRSSNFLCLLKIGFSMAAIGVLAVLSYYVFIQWWAFIWRPNAWICWWIKQYRSFASFTGSPASPPCIDNPWRSFGFCLPKVYELGTTSAIPQRNGVDQLRKMWRIYRSRCKIKLMNVRRKWKWK